ncbi:MAG: hypothetical protein KatS3mg029_0929 [Saprospiraceae bacterium]|nr:MAG: hypothetical protein KatS3mg029_0929 [Saprospiraceae bacterium]
MKQRPDIVYYTLFPWEQPFSSVSLSLTRALSKEARVFYLNPPYTWKDWLRRRQEPLTRRRSRNMALGRNHYEQIPGLDGVVAVQPPPVIPINFLPEGKIYRAFYHLNRRIMWGAVKQLVSDYGLRDFIFFNCYNPYYIGVLPGQSGVRLNVYHCVDEMAEEPYTARHGARLEREVIRQADLVFATSRGLLRKCQQLNRRAFPLFNAADTSLFETALQAQPRPAMLQQLQGPIIGFTGNMDPHRIDYELLAQLAQAHADKHLVLVGPVNSDGPRRTGLYDMPNVHFAGPQPLQDLPAWLHHFDVAIIPFAINKLTAGIYPLKINEYLAAGRAVVATRFSDDIASFEDHIYLAADRAEFIRLIDRAVAEDSEQKRQLRRQVARENDWNSRARQFWQAIESCLGTLKPTTSTLT